MKAMTKLSPEVQVEVLNRIVKLRIAPSPIHGVGVFATRNIAKGDKLFADNMPDIYNLPYQYFDRLEPKVRDIILERWPQVLNGSQFIYPDARLLAYMNHSEDSNYDSVADMTKRDIMDGEEITEDYRNIPGYMEVFPWLKPVDKKSKKKVL